MHKKLLTFGATVLGTLMLGAGTAGAFQCTNANKPAGAGAQVVIGANDEIVSATKGVQNRVNRGLINPDTGDGYHGLIGFDEDGDGIADSMSYIVTPDSEIPVQAQQNGSPDHGIINICGGSCE